ncbi:MAG: glycosyltransferase family 2 protein [Marinirhabdus sp.]|nr:glycosyltransferase family 2 protein [Marinirhabdus sp.]
MNIQIVIPAHNEAEHLAKTLASLVSQSLQPKKIVIVNDNSTDDTQSIINNYIERYDFIFGVTTQATHAHEPGSKVINAFYRGLELVDESYDIICKFDADLIFPKHYLERITEIFQNDAQIGMAGGFCYIEKNGQWELENLTNKDHIRGALKAYRKACFEDIGQLKTAMGWDTVDELLAQYHGWKIVTDERLHVKHLKPTGNTYTEASKYKQGEAFYKMRYGWTLTQIAAIKLAQRKGSTTFYLNCMRGYKKAKKEQAPFLVTEKEGAFIRKLRWKGVRKKFFGTS